MLVKNIAISLGNVKLTYVLLQEFLKNSNLVDEWSVLNEGPDTDTSLVYLNKIPDWKIIANMNSEQIKTLNLLRLEDGALSVHPSADLDTFRQDVEKECAMLEESENESDDTISYHEQDIGVQCWIGILRLLVNTRDETSLARVLTQTGLLTGSQCQIVRQETSKQCLAMYQYLVSHVTQATLGGKSYAPDEEHPFAEFQVGMWIQILP